MNTNRNLWFGVIISAVVLGLAVVYLLNSWMPQNVLNWVTFVVVALVAVRSVGRIAVLAKQAGESNDTNK
jgi:membrane protein required for beta-lactamase induction